MINLRRPVRRWISGWLVLSVLFTQVATVAHACALGRAAEATVSTATAAPCSEAMQGEGAAMIEPAGLCQQHCQFGATQLTADPGQLLHPPAAMPVFLFALPDVVATTLPEAAWTEHVRSRDRGSPLAHRIIHCCYRV